MKEFDYETFGDFCGEQTSLVANAEKYSKQDVINLFIKEAGSLDLDDKYRDLSDEELRECITESMVEEIYVRPATEEECYEYEVDDYWFVGEESDEGSVRCWQLSKDDLFLPEDFESVPDPIALAYMDGVEEEF